MPVSISRPPVAPTSVRRAIWILGACLLAARPVAAAEDSCFRPVAEFMPLLATMEQSWDAVTDYTALLLKTERFVDGTVTKERGRIRFRKPNQLYLHVLEGANAGAQVLFPKPGTDSIVLGRPGGITGAVAGFLVKVPAIGSLIPHEFDLDEGRLMEGQHHPLTDSTLEGMMRLVSVNVRAAARNMEGSACLRPPQLVDGKRTRPLELRSPARAGVWHHVAEGDTLWTIGRKYQQDRYVILYNNPRIDPVNPLPVGTKVFVPRYYAPRAVIWVGESSNLPLKLEMYDAEDRIYESYTNTKLELDVGLTDEDFDPVRHGFPAVATASEKTSEKRSR